MKHVRSPSKERVWKEFVHISATTCKMVQQAKFGIEGAETQATTGTAIATLMLD